MVRTKIKLALNIILGLVYLPLQNSHIATANDYGGYGCGARLGVEDPSTVTQPSKKAVEIKLSLQQQHFLERKILI